MPRNPELSVREPEGCSLSRVTSFNKHNVDQFFANLDLSAFKAVGSATSGERGILVTTCFIVNTTRSFIPPVMVFPRKKFKQHMLHGAAKAGWLCISGFIYRSHESL